MARLLLLALKDLRPHLVIAAIVLVYGIYLVRKLSANHRGAAKWILLPMAALIAGPLLAIGFWALDVFVVSPGYYASHEERLDILPDLLQLGTLIGGVVALVFAIALRVRFPKNRQHTGCQSD